MKQNIEKRTQETWLGVVSKKIKILLRSKYKSAGKIYVLQLLKREGIAGELREIRSNSRLERFFSSSAIVRALVVRTVINSVI